VRLAKSTRIWLAVFLTSAAATIVLQTTAGGDGDGDAGCAATLLGLLAVAALLVLLGRAVSALFRVVVRRTTLRLAFSYFLIGVVPIPLVAALLVLTSYIVAHQYMANRLRREITAVGETAVFRGADLPSVQARGSRVERSDVPWLKAGKDAPWIPAMTRPGFLVANERLWLVVPAGTGTVRLLDLSDPDAPWLQALADRTGYEIGAEASEASEHDRGITVRTDVPEKPQPKILEPPSRRPTGAPPPETGLLRGEWIHAFYLETVLDAAAEPVYDVAVLMAKASPRQLVDQLFAQGVKDVGKIFWIAFVAVGSILLLVYLVALIIAFVLVGSIARNVNRLTRATAAIGRGDFSVRIHSKSRDQIGDLARSFDGMAESIQKSLAATAEKERIQSELAIARTIQHKLLPPPEAQLAGLTVHAYFEPVAEIGGDYYDYLPMPDGRTAIALGDVSGHGLATGLLVAMAKAALSTLLEAGHHGAELLGRLNEIIHRSTDPRHYMTLVLFAFDPATRRGLLANAGQLAPYRVANGKVEALSLPGLPLGLFPDRTFPEREFGFASGDILVFLTDGFVEAVDSNDEAFGFERLESLLAANAAGGAPAIRDALLAAVRAHSGSRSADDDRTLMILTIA
jgi:serine phosphatase RsbU (regulator of sigma subunit)